MLARRVQTYRLASVSFFSTSSTPSSSSSSSSTDESQTSIFSASESPWDHVFSDIEPVENKLPVSTTPTPAQRIRARLQQDGLSRASHSSRPKDKNKEQVPSSTNSSLVQRASSVKRQRASITAREMSVFDDMFDMIFNAVSSREGSGSSTRVPGGGSSLPGNQTPSIGVGHMAGGSPPLNDIFRTLRRHTSRVRWTTAIDEELDRKKETMELFDTDHELLRWVTNELFGESQQWDEEARRAMVGAASGKDKGDGPAAAAPSRSLKEPGHHSIYPHLIAHAMRIFRTTYSNPSLSLAIFDHAARVSIPSYVFGCTAPVYNELIEARWEGWGDLEGVCHALEEMRANGVKMDGKTRLLVENVRREVGEARPVGSMAEPDDHAKPLAKRVWERLGETEVMRLLHRMERLALRERSRRSVTRPSPQEESWKSAVLDPDPVQDDGWRFDKWGSTSSQSRW